MEQCRANCALHSRVLRDPLKHAPTAIKKLEVCRYRSVISWPALLVCIGEWDSRDSSVNETITVLRKIEPCINGEQIESALRQTTLTWSVVRR